MNNRDESDPDTDLSSDPNPGPLDDDIFETTFDPETDVSLNNAVVDAVAAVSGKTPTELPPLHDAIDTDALESLFDYSRIGSVDTGQQIDGDRQVATNLTLTFSYGGFVVRIRGDGTILIFADDRQD